MLDQETRDKLLQKKFDAYCSVHTHRHYIAKIDAQLLLIDILAVCVPVGFLAVQYVTVDYEKTTVLLSGLNTLLSTALIILVIIASMFGWRGKPRDHQRFLAENLPVIDEIDEVLRDVKADIKDAKRIFDKTTALDKAELELLPKIPDTERQGFYREALKSAGGVDVMCPFCKASPWRYQPGSCQMCGNQPTNTRALGRSVI